MHKSLLLLACFACTGCARRLQTMQAPRMGAGNKPLPDGLSVFIATPAYGGTVAVEYALSVVTMVATLKEVSWIFELTGGASIITVGRNDLVMQFLASGCTHMLFLDADVGVDVDTIKGLIALDVDVALAPYPGKHFNEERIVETATRTAKPPRLSSGLNWNLYLQPEKFTEAMEKGSRYVEVDAGPVGCMLIKRSAINRMIDAYPDMHASITGSKEGRPYKFEKWWRFFDTMVTEEGEFLSEDIAFCKKWRAIGGLIYADMKAVLTHVGPNHFTGSLLDFLQLT